MLKTCFFSLYPGYEYSFVEQLEVLMVIFFTLFQKRNKKERSFMCTDSPLTPSNSFTNGQAHQVEDFEYLKAKQSQLLHKKMFKWVPDEITQESFAHM